MKEISFLLLIPNGAEEKFPNNVNPMSSSMLAESLGAVVIRNVHKPECGFRWSFVGYVWMGVALR